MLSPFYSVSGIAYPDDIKSLKQAFDRICHDLGIPVSSHEAEDVAHAIMALFAAGIVNEDEIVSKLTCSQ